MNRIFTPLLYLIFGCAVPFNMYGQGVHQLWGTTAYGGPTNTGTIFSLDMNGNKFTNRHNFQVQNFVYGTGESKLTEYNGKFYGTTIFGGINGDGVLFEWDPATSVLTNKVEFDYSDEGAQPGDLLLQDGKLYGTCRYGGANLGGVLFEYDPATNIFTKKVEFGYIDGSGPSRTLAMKDGKFYGTTLFGGTNSTGVIFEYDPGTNTYTKKRELDNATGIICNAGMILFSDKFYGLAQTGGVSSTGGVLFEWDPATNILTGKHDFIWGSVDGFSPMGKLTLSGSKFYGLTQSGGSTTGGPATGNGVLFEWDPAGNTYIKKLNFTTATGINPYGDLELFSGKLYGLTSAGGTNNLGTIFEYDPLTPLFTKKTDLTAAGGSNPRGSLLLSNGKMYGIMPFGGQDYNGVLFEWDPVSNVYSKKVDLVLSDGMGPTLQLSHKNGRHYGIVSYGAAGFYGSIYEWDPASSQISKLVELGTANGSVPTYGTYDGASNGASPCATLIENGNKFFGLTLIGGANGQGTIFEWDPSANVFTKKLDLPAAPFINPTVERDFVVPFGVFIPYNNKYVGVINKGGTEAVGYIFEWDPSSNNFTKLKDFTVPNGAIPYPSLDSFNGKFYGTTYLGGANNEGTLFEWDPATNTYTKKIDFAAGASGSHPLGGLSLINGKFYGTTYTGGLNDRGVLFEYDPAGNTYTKKDDAAASYNNIDKPFGRMVKNGNRLYGLSAKGGVSDSGTVYEWRPVVDSVFVHNSFNGQNGLVNFDGELLGFNELAITPAPISKGTPGACTTYVSEQIYNPNHFSWVPLTDANGDVIAEINANGQDLGFVNYSININTGPLREDLGHRLILDRNFIITPQVQPTSRVDLRFYITEEEFQRLKAADDAFDDPFDQLDGYDDLKIVVSHSNICTNTVQQTYTGLPIVSIEPYENGYVISTFVTSFSTFYIANFDYILLPVTLVSFNGKTAGADAELQWKTANENNLKGFVVERSINGKDFVPAGSVAAFNDPSDHEYRFTDRQIQNHGASRLYYRLRQEDIDGKAAYSRVLVLTINEKGNIAMIYPNPVKKELGLMVTTQRSQQVKWTIADNSGRVIRQGSIFVNTGSTNTNLDISSLARGVYYLSLEGEMMRERLKVIKE